MMMRLNETDLYYLKKASQILLDLCDKEADIDLSRALSDLGYDVSTVYKRESLLLKEHQDEKRKTEGIFE